MTTNPHSEVLEGLRNIVREVDEEKEIPGAMTEEFSQNALHRYTARIIMMMNDYKIDMAEALLWDFESFGYDTSAIYKKHGMKGVKEVFEIYLYRINRVVKDKDISFFRDIFVGESQNIVLRKEE